ncbi:MAG: hypothetical protein MUF28_15565 [Ignavibacterium sp.]|jgi:hypothetical protein|nr:hypothetical protein [Ignavibacterium sp.]
MINVKSFLVYLILKFAVLFNSFGQGDFKNGYIVKAPGDTIKGYVDNRSDKENEHTCYFRTDRHSKIMKYSVDDLIGFGIYGYNQYEVITIPELSSKQFVEVLTRGYFNLLFAKKDFYLQGDSIIKLPHKSKDQIYSDYNTQRVKKDKRYVYLLNYLFKDCGINSDNVGYQRRELIEVVNKFNQCKNNSRPISRNLPPVRFSISMMAGIDFTRINAPDFSTSGFSINDSQTIGGGIAVNFPSASRRIWLTVDYFTTQKSFYTFDQPVVPDIYVINYRNDVWINTDIRKLQFGIKYNIYPGRNTPYFNVGLQKLFFENVQKTVLTEREYNKVVSTYEENTSYNNSMSNGFWFGVGYMHSIYSRICVFGEARLEKPINYLSDIFESNSKVNVGTFTIGLRF